MKKITILTFAIVLSSLVSHSQVTKRNWMIGGNINYLSTNYNSENYGEPHTYHNLKVNPSVGYFFIDRFAAGLKAGISREGQKGYGNSYTDFNIGPYIRYYFLDPEKNVNIFSETMYQYGFVGSLSGDNNSTSKNTFALSAGPVIYFNSVVGIEFLVSYSTYKFAGTKGSNNTIMFGIGLQVHLEKEK